MTRQSIARVGAVTLALSLAGCVLPPRSGPAGITPRPGLPAVAVYRFTDERGQEERLIGQRFFHGRSSPWPYDPPPRKLRARKPVATTVSRALAAALRARGFAVVDRTDMPFAGAAAGGDVRLAVSGRVLRYWSEHHRWVSGPASAFRNQAECALVVEAYATATGDKRWEKRYAREGASVEEALARTVRAAVLDGELVAALARQAE